MQKKTFLVFKYQLFLLNLYFFSSSMTFQLQFCQFLSTRPIHREKKKKDCNNETKPGEFSRQMFEI